MRCSLGMVVGAGLGLWLTTGWAQGVVKPHAQDVPPGPALSPAEAIKKMTVPKGFTVELVASEPDLVNPVAMTFDEKGRVWVTESLEYPRREPGPGKDRVKVLEDTDNDGKADRFTVFAEGLNIPSGIAVGYGGVWVANSPDILFLQDTDGDGKADKQEVVVTGFGRDDTHELPNSLTWGPDGWLYGLNGVFNHSHVRYPKNNPNYKEGHAGWPITCALWRIHPRTREFQVYCEGTSNPWGVAINDDGNFFVSACVIDHLWHLVETGYYHRQGGPYPPHTWKIESIVGHKHQKAAYCGITWYDSDAYPEPFRRKLYMGNIHGSCINADQIQPRGSTYQGSPEPDFLSAHDAWFMPVVQKTGPDGCLWILDWYDRYHCYQDANRDPAGIDRLKGRLYRIRYAGVPHRSGFDLSKSADEELLKTLGSANGYDRDIAQRLLAERDTPVIRERLEALVLSADTPQIQCRHALFTRLGCTWKADESHWKFCQKLVEHADPGVRAWAPVLLVDRCGPLAYKFSEAFQSKTFEDLHDLAQDPSPAVRRQAVIAVGHIGRGRYVQLGKNHLYINNSQTLWQALALADDDPLVPRVAWQNLQPWLIAEPKMALESLLVSGFGPGDHELKSYYESEPVLNLFPRMVEFLLDRQRQNPEYVTNLLRPISQDAPLQVAAAQKCLSVIAQKVQTGELAGNDLDHWKDALQPLLHNALANRSHPLALDAALLASSWKDPQGLTFAREIFLNPTAPEDQRSRALAAVITAKDDRLLDAAAMVLSGESPASPNFLGQTLSTLGRLDQPQVAAVVLNAYPKLAPALQPQAIELLTQRVVWAKQLVSAMQAKVIPSTALNLNQVRKLLAFKDTDLSALVTANWGTLREGRNPQREQVQMEMKHLLRKSTGNPESGKKVFAKVCGQCHKLHGEGTDVGPDITANGRASFDQLMSNVFDPNLVIGAAYQARTIATTEGRVVTGLLVEESPQRVVLKIQGGKQEIIPLDQIEDMKVSSVSLMPEDLEKQLKPTELADLFAYISLDKPYTDPEAKFLSGYRAPLPRETRKPEEFSSLIQEIAPGFTINGSGEGGVAILGDHAGRQGVLRTHPLAENRPTILTRKLTISAMGTTRLKLSVSHHPQGDWKLLVKANGELLADQIVGPKTVKEGWLAVDLDLTKFAGKEVTLELFNQANDWAWEFGYWGDVTISNNAPPPAAGG